jgi:hypothetical protein
MVANAIRHQCLYKTVHQLVRYRLGAAPKVARPKSIDNTDERVETYKKTWQRI